MLSEAKELLFAFWQRLVLRYRNPCSSAFCKLFAASYSPVARIPRPAL